MCKQRLLATTLLVLLATWMTGCASSQYDGVNLKVAETTSSADDYHPRKTDNKDAKSKITETIDVEETTETVGEESQNEFNSEIDSIVIDPERENDWFESHGLHISPQGHFTFQTMENDGYVDTGMLDVPSYITMTETTEGCDEGWKKITISLDMNTSNQEAEWVYWMNGLFDRYTGIILQGRKMTNSDSVVNSITFTFGDETYNSTMWQEQTFNPEKGIVSYTETILVPEFYDGAVYRVGYFNLELAKQADSFDISTRPYCTVDEVPGFLDNIQSYYFFSPTNK